MYKAGTEVLDIIHNIYATDNTNKIILTYTTVLLIWYVNHSMTVNNGSPPPPPPPHPYIMVNGYPQKNKNLTTTTTIKQHANDDDEGEKKEKKRRYIYIYHYTWMVSKLLMTTTPTFFWKHLLSFFKWTWGIFLHLLLIKLKEKTEIMKTHTLVKGWIHRNRGDLNVVSPFYIFFLHSVQLFELEGSDSDTCFSFGLLVLVLAGLFRCLIL